MIKKYEEGFLLIDNNDEKKLLYDSVNKFGVKLTGNQIDKLCHFVDLLTEWNRKKNLVGTHDRLRIINELLLDSVVPVPFLPESGNLVDFGSGAGFPAMIIKILKPGLDVKLLESNGKKVSFLKYAIHSLRLKGITAVNARIESLSENLKEWGCEVVTSRAMASLEEVIRLSDPFLGPGGIIVGFLGKEGAEELKNIREILIDRRLEIKDSITYRLPEKEAERTTVLLQKVAFSCPSHY